MTAAETLTYVSIAGGAITILGAIIAVWAYWRPARRRGLAAYDAILGEEEVRDRSGNLIRPARPGLVHLQSDNSSRLGKVEEAIVAFQHTTGIVTEFSGRLDRVEADVNLLKNNQVKDALNAAERAATAAASAEMLRLAHERDTHAGEADEAADLE